MSQLKWCSPLNAAAALRKSVGDSEAARDVLDFLAGAMRAPAVSAAVQHGAAQRQNWPRPQPLSTQRRAARVMYGFSRGSCHTSAQRCGHTCASNPVALTVLCSMT